MIEQLLSHKDTMPYALAIAAIIMATVLGYLLGHQDEAELCAPRLIEIERLTDQNSQLNADLTTCQAKGAAGAVLDCAPICAGRVREALQNHRDIVCED